MKGHWRTEIDLRERQVLWGGMCALLGVRTPSPWPDPVTGSRTGIYTEKYKDTVMAAEQILLGSGRSFSPCYFWRLKSVPANRLLKGARDPVTH